MPTLQIIFKGDDQLTGTVNRAAQSFTTLEQSASRAGKAVEKATKFDTRDFASGFVKQFQTIPGVVDNAAEKIDRMGRQGRIGLMGLAQAADLVGINISGVVAPASAAADAVGDIAGAASALGPVGIALGVITAAVGVAAFALDQYNQRIAENIMWGNQYLQNAYMIAAQNSELASSFERLKQAHISSAQLGIDDLVRAVPQLALFNAGLQAIGMGVEDMDVALVKAKASFEALAWGVDSGYDAVERMRATMPQLTSATDAAAAATLRATQANDAYAASLAKSIELLAGQVNAAASMAQAERTVDSWMPRLAAGNKAYNEVVTRGTQLLNENDEAQRRLAETIRTQAVAAWNQLKQAVRGFVEQAMQPTQVTMEDLNAAMAGKYIPKWDEFRRRVEAIASGSGIEQFGPKFKAQLEMVQGLFKGLNLEQIAAKFKDFSLFADLNVDQIKALIDFGPIEAQVSQQIDSIIGKAKAMQVAFDEVWASLSAQKKIDLAQALNIDIKSVDINSAQVQDQIQKALTGAGGVGQTQVAATVQTKLAFDHAAADKEAAAAQAKILAIPASKAGETVKTLLNVDHAAADAAVSALTSAIAGIPASKDGETVTTIVDVVKAATFDTNFDAIMEKINSIPTEITVKVNVEGGGGGGESGGTGGEGGGGTPPVGQQHGGMGVLARDTLFYAHAGEGYWFSGVPWRVPPPAGGSDARFGPPVITIGTVVVRDPEDAKKLAREIIREWEENLMRSGRALERH